MIWIDWDLDVRSIGHNQPQSLVEFRGICFLGQHRTIASADLLCGVALSLSF